MTTHTPVEITIRLDVAAAPDDVAEQMAAALANLAEVMAVQAEDGLWSLGSPDAEDDDGPSEYLADITRATVRSVMFIPRDREGA